MNPLYYDVFNGDADGICSLHQLRLMEPRPESVLVSGVKRDICLLRQLGDAREAEVTVLDVSLDRNRPELLNLLANGCRIFYADHHFAGQLPEAAGLEVHIDPDPDTCTSLIIDRLLKGRFSAWAAAGAFGDNLHATANRAAAALGLNAGQLERLRELGELFNYNGYGATVADLHFPPTALYEAIRPFADPFEFMHSSNVLNRLREGFNEDMARARAASPLQQSASGRVFQLPAAAWARRVAGVFSNELARQRPELAHALLIENADKTLLVSVRAPLIRKEKADSLCRAFPTGGGRAAAAGINKLPAEMLTEFLHSFAQVFSS